MKRTPAIIFKSLLCLTAGLLASVASAQTDLSIVNPGFELPATHKIQGGFDVADGTSDVPGWLDAAGAAGTVTNSDAGIDNPDTHQHSGTWNGYCMGGDPGAYQITTNIMSWGKKYTLTWWGSESWNHSIERTSLIRAGATNTVSTNCTELKVASIAVPQDGSYNQYSLTYIAGNADVGHYLGIAFRNTGPDGSSWCNWDDFDLTEQGLILSELLPSITTQPVNQTVYEGSPLALTVEAIGPDLVYQWQAGAPGSGIYTSIPGATNPSLTISYAHITDTADYVVVVTNNQGSVTSSVASVTITPATYDASGLFNADFELPATGKIYDGFDDMSGNDVPGWRNCGPLQNDEGIESSGNGFTGNYCAYLHRGNDGAYQISTNVLHLGDTVLLTWYQRDSWNGVNAKVSILGASSKDADFASTIILAGSTNEVTGWWTQGSLTYIARAGDVGKYVGVAFQTAEPDTVAGWANFDDFALTTPVPPVPIIISEPSSQTVWWGRSTTFHVVASGIGFHYQWQAGAVGSGIYTNISNAGQFSGADSSALSIANTTAANGLDYVVIVSKTGRSVTSAPPATLTVNTGPPNIITPPASATVYPYDTITLSAVVDGAMSYQWKAGAVGSGIYTNLSNNSHFAGVDTATLTITNVQLADQLDYVIVVTNLGGTSVSFPATLTVIHVIYSQPFNTATTNDISVVGWVLSGGSGGLSDGGWPGTCVFAFGNTNVPQAFYTTTFIENGSVPDQMAFPVINLTNVTGLTFSMDYNSWWRASATHTYFAVQMNWGPWYIQSTEVTQAVYLKQTATVSFDPTASSWNQFTVSGAGTNSSDATATVIGSVATSDLTGYITGAGMVSLHDGTVDTAWVKMDNFRIYAATYTPVSGLSYTKSGANVTLTWGYGTLVEATSITGPWTPVSGMSPKTVSPTDANHFYRLQLVQ